jgi:lysophospholipase L1-like esterase
VAAPTAATADRFAQWEADVRGFEDEDRRNPPPTGAVLFYGSSSIRFWESLARDFPDQRVINRGFGGSQMDDALHFVDRIVLPYRPRVIVLYEGDNDLAAGRTPAAIVADYRAFVDTVRHRLPETRVVFVAIKPSLARWNLVDRIRETNALVQRYVERDPAHLAYADVFTPMLGTDGRPRPELFREDGLHMTPQGYALWTEVVRPLLR